jgi:hypothetical protein
MRARVIFGLGAILRFGDEVSDDAFDITSWCNIDRLFTGDDESHTCIEACNKSKCKPAQLLR